MDKIALVRGVALWGLTSLVLAAAAASAFYGQRRMSKLFGPGTRPPHRWFGRPGPITPDMLDGSFWLDNYGKTLILTHGQRQPRPVFARGELVFCTDDKSFHVGDGMTPGGALHWTLTQ